jgi:hypothetical protein
MSALPGRETVPRAEPSLWLLLFRLDLWQVSACSAWRAVRTAHDLPGGLPRSPQPRACGDGWGELPVGTRARCGEAPVGGRA